MVVGKPNLYTRWLREGKLALQRIGREVRAKPANLLSRRDEKAWNFAIKCRTSSANFRQTLWSTLNPLKLVIQIPCFNEASSLASTLASLPRHIPGVREIEI